MKYDCQIYSINSPVETDSFIPRVYPRNILRASEEAGRVLGVVSADSYWTLTMIVKIVILEYGRDPIILRLLEFFFNNFEGELQNPFENPIARRKSFNSFLKLCAQSSYTCFDPVKTFNS